MGRKTFLAGVVVGAGAMYLLDPEHGPGRRLEFPPLTEGGAAVSLVVSH